MTAKTSLDLIREAAERISNDPVKLKEFLRKVMGPERRKIEGIEREHLFTVFRLLEPVESTNNQRSFTDVYEHAGKTYHVHYFEGEIELEEILPDDIQQN